MPTYEYACSSCANEWETEQSIKDAALTACPKCHKKTAKRQISRGGGFILKGGGWYSDLYSSSGNKAAKPEAKADATTGTEASSTTKTETKSETKSETKTDSATSTSSPATKTGSTGDSKSVAAA